MFNLIAAVKNRFVKPSARDYLSRVDLNTFTPPVLNTSVLFGMKDSFIAPDTKPVLTELLFEEYTIPADSIQEVTIMAAVLDENYMWRVSFDEFSSAGDPALFLLRLDTDGAIRIVDSENLGGSYWLHPAEVVEDCAEEIVKRYMAPVTV